MANIFKEAKKIHRAHPRLDWQECIQRAKKHHKKKPVKPAKKKSYRQTGHSNKSIDKKRHARPPGARIPKGGTHVTYYERRKNRSDVPGSLTGLSAAQLTSELKKRLHLKENGLVIRKYREKKKSVKKKLQKEITAVKQRLRKLI